MAREAEHRSKNLLATVQATINLSQSDTPEGLKHAIEGRIRALANVHSLFVETRWIGAELSAIATQELAPYCENDETRVQIDGPQVLLEPNAAQAIAVTLHELATNAAKYGALSVAKGQVDLKWSHEADERLILQDAMGQHGDNRTCGIDRRVSSCSGVSSDWRRNPTDRALRYMMSEFVIALAMELHRPARRQSRQKAVRRSHRLRHDNWVILGARCGQNSFSSGTTSVLRAVFASRDEPMASAPALPEATVSGQFVQIFGRKENPRGGDVLVKVRHR